ncbi:hypothetical protein BDZ45DRAFT_656420 [Acephala macrosclerotiorum]|nr:hypothetical protein BDZ45DRAFT_656420 [Acephala macrosclerotiorum]
MATPPQNGISHDPGSRHQQCQSSAIETPSSLAAAVGTLHQATMKANISANGEDPSRSMTESQRALELRKFFAPLSSVNSTIEDNFNETLNSDGALDAYAETLVWRLKGVHAMVSLVDRGTQYFLAGALRVGSEQHDTSDVDVLTTGKWFGCSTVPTPGGLCENTLALDPSQDEYPCFIVNDLSKDGRFASLPVVDGTIVSYRFYAGTPITTNHGINIGSFFLFDDKVRDGLTLNQRKFLHQQASNVMKHLETKREAAERRRVALMSKGIARFLERTAQHTSNDDAAKVNKDATQTNQNEPIDNITPVASNESQPTDSNAIAKESVLDKIRSALDQAANILQESLELTVGGVVFLDTAKGYSETGNTEAYLDSATDIGSHVELVKREEKQRQRSNDTNRRPTLSKKDGNSQQISQESTRSFSDDHKAAKVLAMSAARVATWDPDANVLDAKTLQALINTYPQGNVWYTDEEGYFSSLEQQNELQETAGRSPSERRKSVPFINLTHQKAEATLLSRIFHKARQIIFLPLWDTAGERWYSGCFVWSRSAVPVFTVESEVAYLSAFTNSVMVEISRLDAITSNKMKSDFISSISHEFRSPLHGILASAEFLRDSDLDASQMEFISTITNCSGTLLDTINHVLDYSKINSFEKTGNQKGAIINELIQVTNLALLCEDICNGMIAASEFRGTDDPTSAISREFRSAAEAHAPRGRRAALDIILDIERRDWYYNIQAGALRRVVMNLFGNALKYTESGYIMVQMRIRENAQSRHNGSLGNVLYLKIRDSGRGMSTEYMERKLYHPFAQEDSFAPGVGLGLSIVWSIVNQLGGQISIRSQVGKGTEVEVTIPVEKVEAPMFDHMEPSSTKEILLDAQKCIAKVQARASTKSIRLSRVKDNDTRAKDITWACIEKYCVEWFGFTTSTSSADFVITDHQNEGGYEKGQRILVVHNDVSCSAKQVGAHRNYAIGHIRPPVGPFRLARCLMALMDPELSTVAAEMSAFHVNRATQTPLGSPEERSIMNGIILTDYGFTPQTTLSNTPISVDSQELEKRDDTILSQEVHSRNNDQLDASINALSQISLDSQNGSATQCIPSTMPPPSTFGRLQLPQPKKSGVAFTETAKSLHILAVDDNALNLQLLQRYLAKRKSDTVVTARDGLEAVAAVREAGSEKQFDIIFMDISMPNMNGFEATRAIRALERKVFRRAAATTERKLMGTESSEDGGFDEQSQIMKLDLEKDRTFIVALTGLASRRDRVEAEESGFDDFLTKPISFIKIGEMLKRMSEEKTAV